MLNEILREDNKELRYNKEGQLNKYT